jgi:Sugar transferases involved in lipopolysaccharide synthesis
MSFSQPDAIQSDIDSTLDVVDYKLIRSFYNIFAKRIIDLPLAIIFLILLSPVFLFVSIAIIIDSGFPIFYRAERGGYKGRIFYIIKFRSMVKNADIKGGGTTALNDTRITKIGKLLRKTKIDEFPQLLNIIKGEMSFVGPRPELTLYTSRYIGKEKAISEVRPGITDYSSLEYISLDEIVGNQNADEVYEKLVLKQKNQLRVKYAETISFITDFKLFFGTIQKVIQKAIKYFMRKKKKDEISWNI